MGSLTNWEAITNLKLLTVGSENLFVSHYEGNSVCFSKPNIGSKQSEEKALICGYAVMCSENQVIILILSHNGAVCRLNLEESSDVSLSPIVPTASKVIQYLCRHCIAMFADYSKVREHIFKNHKGPVSCPICKYTFLDNLKLVAHKKEVFFRVAFKVVRKDAENCVTQ